MAAIYKITNLINNKVYIGRATNFLKRKNSHLCYLRKGNHSNSHLQASWDKYGEENFVFEVLEVCEKEDLGNKEYEWVTLLKSTQTEFGYNIQIVNGNETYEISDETRIKMSNSQKGRVTSEETRRKQSEARKGRVNSIETRERISNSLKGKKANHSEEQKEASRKRAIAKKGNFKPEELEKMSLKASKPIIQYTVEGEFIREFKSGLEAHKVTGINNANIAACANNKRRIAGGYKWLYKYTNKIASIIKIKLKQERE